MEYAHVFNQFDSDDILYSNICNLRQKDNNQKFAIAAIIMIICFFVMYNVLFLPVFLIITAVVCTFGKTTFYEMFGKSVQIVLKSGTIHRIILKPKNNEIVSSLSLSLSDITNLRLVGDVIYCYANKSLIKFYFEENTNEVYDYLDKVVSGYREEYQTSIKVKIHPDYDEKVIKKVFQNHPKIKSHLKADDVVFISSFPKRKTLTLWRLFWTVPYIIFFWFVQFLPEFGFFKYVIDNRSLNILEYFQHNQFSFSEDIPTIFIVFFAILLIFATKGIISYFRDTQVQAITKSNKFVELEINELKNKVKVKRSKLLNDFTGLKYKKNKIYLYYEYSDPGESPTVVRTEDYYLIGFGNNDALYVVVK